MALNDGDTTPHGDYELRYEYVETGLKGGRHVIQAHHPDDGQVGRLEWMGRKPYAIHSLQVSDDHQRKGLATAMWDWSQAQGRPKPTHSQQRTDKGEAWARSVGGRLPRRIASAAGDFSSYFGGGHGISGTSIGSYFGGRGKPRRDGGGSGAAPQGGGGSTPQGGEAGQGDSGAPGVGQSRSVEFHPRAAKDLQKLDGPMRSRAKKVVDALAAGDEGLQTHALYTNMKGWYSTKINHDHRIVHRPTDDGGLHIVYVGLHGYDEAARRLGSLSREPGPVTFPYLRNTEGAPNLGRAYGQDIEPHGRYLSYHAGDKPEGDRWETGEVSFQNPLHLDFGGNYGDPSNWKNQLSQQHGGKRGKALSRAVVKSGHDGIITHDGYGPSEIVDLTGLKAKTAEHQDDKPLPNELYHVTTARDDVLEHGLKTRDELGQRHGHGFGSGKDDTISLTTHKPTAQHLLHSLHEYHDVLNGKTPLTELKEKARKGVGAKKPYDFMFDAHDQSDERLAQVDSGRVTEPRFHVLGEQPEGWVPKDEGMTGQGGARSHFLWEHPLSEDEKIKERSAAYKNFAWGRQVKGGHMDPLFMGNDPKSFAAKDPSQFALLHVRPEEGAHGIQMNDRTEGTDAGEWRAHSGNDLRVVHHESHADIPSREAARKTLDDLAHHQRAVADAQNAVRLEYPTMHTEIWPGEDADDALRHMLKQHGHPRHEDAFVSIHDGSRGFSSTAKDRETGAVGVVLHPARADYGTLAHEAAHLLHDHQTGRGFREPSPDESVHGIGFIQHYAALLDPFGKTRTPGGNRKGGGPGDLLLNTYYDSLNQRRKTSAHAAPTSRVFGPTHGLDHRLFEGETLKPEVRMAVMDRLDGVLGPMVGFSWREWSKVYLAGSEASEWTSATLEGNGDFDTLIGVNYDRAREMEPGKLGDFDDERITWALNVALRFGYNASPWKPAFGGEWDLTGFCNPNSYDITRIKPYAAYNITDDTWAVKPPHLPDWGIDKLPEGGANLLAEAEGYAAVVEAISKMPEPFQTQQGRALWHHLHTDRGRAFSDQGEGWLDPGNLIEKALVEWGVWDKLVEWQYGTQHTAATDPPTIKRGVILDGHPVTGHIKDGDWNAGGWDPDVAHRLVKGTATHHDVLKHLNTNQVGHFWYHPDHADIEDAQGFASPSEPIKNWMDDPGEDGRIAGEVGVVMEAHHPKGWDPNEQNPSHPLMGNSYLPDNSHLRLHKLHYTADGGENWHTIPVEHHGITLHTDGPGGQKTAASAYDPDDDDHYRSYTDWDKAYPRLPEDIHRGVAVQLDPDTHEAIHGEGHSEADRARAAVQAATLKPLGMHWSSAGSEMAGRIAEDEAEQLTPRERRNITHVVLHADRPERQHIETNIDKLVQHSVISHGRSPENEVPLKEHVPVHIWGVSWKHHDEPDWHSHEFDQPMTKTAVKSSDHELAPDLPQEQHDALSVEPYMEYRRQTLDLAKKPVPGTHMWRAETRSGDPVQGAHETGVGMHWSVNPDGIAPTRPRNDDEQSVVYHAELEHPGEQNYTRDHPMWHGKHMSMDHEAEVRLKPGSKVKLHGVWTKDPNHPDPGYFIPRHPERMSSAWKYHPIGKHVDVAHRPNGGYTIDYGDVGIGKEGSVIDITAYFRTASDDDYRMMHRPPDHKSGQPLHEADETGDPDEHIRIYRSAPPHVDYFDNNTWATTNPAYAHQHGYGEGVGGKDWPVMSAEVPKKHVFTDHNDENEVGYQGPRLESHQIESHDEDTGTHSPWEPMSDEERKEEERGGNAFHGMGVHLPPADHAFVHDKTQPIAERAHRLFQHVPERLRENGGYQWEDEHHSAEIDTLDEERHHGDHPTPVTQVVVHGSQNLDHAHGLSWANSENDPIHPFRDYEHHEFKGNPNERLNKHSMFDYFGVAA